MKTKNILGLMLLGTLLMLPEMSWALSFFTPAGDDVSVNALLSKMFGGAVPGGSGGAGSDPFSGFFTVLNAGALAVGGILAAYNLVVGSMQTAHEGEMLGRKWSSMWLPIRTAMGTAMVAPLGTGYCVAQLIVMWIAVQGVGLADKGWNAFVSTGFDQMVAGASNASPNVNALASNVLQIQTCMSTLDYLSRKYPTTMGDKAPLATDITGSSEKGMAYGTRLDPNFCGTITVNTSSTERARQSWNNASGWGAVTSAFSSFMSPPQVTALEAKHLSETANLMSRAKQVGDYLVKVSEVNKSGVDASVNLGTESAMISSYLNAVEQYKQNIVSEADGATSVGALNALKADSTKGGWMMAGAWFPKVSAHLNSINAAVNHVPESKIGAVNENKEGLWGNVQGSFSGFISRSNLNDPGNPLAGVNNPEEKSLGVGAWLGKNLGQLFSSVNVDEISKDTRHPVIIAQSIGDRMASIGTGLLALAGATSILEASRGFSGIIAPLALAMLGFGYYLKIYIPLMPFIHFFFGALSWILLVGEAMIAAPLWAVMHLTGSGDDIMGGSRNGYAILLGLLLRPVLLVSGFIFAIIVIYPIGILFNSIYFSVLKLSMVQGAGFVDGFMFMIAALCIYVLLISNLYGKALRLITDVPNQALQWFGAQGHQIGQSGQQAAQEVGGRVKAGIAGGVVGGAMSQGFNGLGQYIANNKASNDKKESAEANQKANMPLFQKMQNANNEAGVNAASLLSESASDGRSVEEIQSSNDRIGKALEALDANENSLIKKYSEGMPQLSAPSTSDKKGPTHFDSMSSQIGQTRASLLQAKQNNDNQLASMAQSKTEKPSDNGQMDLFNDNNRT